MIMFCYCSFSLLSSLVSSSNVCHFTSAVSCVLYGAVYSLCYMLFLQDSWSALLNAAKQGFADIVSLLLEAGANIEHRDTVCILSSVLVTCVIQCSKCKSKWFIRYCSTDTGLQQ